MSDRMVIRGNIITMDSSKPTAEAIATDSGVVVAVGSLQEVRQAVPDCAVLNLGEATLLPGLIDSHNHMLWTGLSSVLVDLSRARTVTELLEAVKQWAHDHPSANWVVGAEGWEVDDLAEHRYPTRWELDAVCPDRPVYLPRGGHAAVVNSKALEIAGVSQISADPPGGIISRDEGGRLDGLLLESARNLVGGFVPPPSSTDRRRALKEIQQKYLAAGITRVMEPGLDREEIAAYRDMDRDRELLVRATLMGLISDGSDPLASGRRLVQEWKDDQWSDTLSFGGLKAFLDGGGSLGTAWLREDYPKRPGYRGERLIPHDALIALVGYCVSESVPLGVHAVGGAAIDAFLEAVWETRPSPEKSRPEAKIHLIHGYLWPSPANMRAAAELGIGVAVQPGMYERFAARLVEHLGLSAVLEASPLRSWLDAGVKIAGGSDSPITTFEPSFGLWSAATRYSADLGMHMNRSQCISRMESLRMYTADAASVSLVGGAEGVLRTGARADWVAMPESPLVCPDDELRDLAPLITAVGGTLLHDCR